MCYFANLAVAEVAEKSTVHAVTERSVGLFTLHTTSFRRGNNSQRNAAPLASARRLRKVALETYRGRVLVTCLRLDRLAQR